MEITARVCTLGVDTRRLFVYVERKWFYNAAVSSAAFFEMPLNLNLSNDILFAFMTYMHHLFSAPLRQQRQDLPLNTGATLELVLVVRCTSG